MDFESQDVSRKPRRSTKQRLWPSVPRRKPWKKNKPNRRPLKPLDASTNQTKAPPEIDIESNTPMIVEPICQSPNTSRKNEKNIQNSSETSERALKRLNKANEGAAEGSAQGSSTEPQPETSDADLVIQDDQNDQSLSCQEYREPEVKIETEEESEVTIVIQDPLSNDTFEGTFRELFAPPPSGGQSEEPASCSESLDEEQDEDRLVIDLPEPRARMPPKPKREKDIEYYKTELAKCKKKLQEKNAELKSKDGEISFFRKSLNSVRDTLKTQCKEKQKVRTLLDKRVEELKNAKKIIRDMKKEEKEEKTIKELKQQLAIMENKLKTQKESMEIIEQNMAIQKPILRTQEISEQNMAVQNLIIQLDAETQNMAAPTQSMRQLTQEKRDQQLAMQIIKLIKELAVQTINAIKRQTIYEQELPIQSIKIEPMDRDVPTQIIYLMKDLSTYTISSMKQQELEDYDESEMVMRVLNTISEEVLVIEILGCLVQELAKATSVMTQRELVKREQCVGGDCGMDIV